MSFIFGGGTTGASQQSQQAQQAANAATQRFIEQRTAEARADVQRIFPQAQQLGAQGFQGALDVLGGGIPQQLAAFQQGNIGAQQVTGDTFSQIQNAILGLPVNTAAFAPQNIETDLSFLSGLQAPGLQDPNAPLPEPPPAAAPPPSFTPPPGIQQPIFGGGGGFGGFDGILDQIGLFQNDLGGPTIRPQSDLQLANPSLIGRNADIFSQISGEPVPQPPAGVTPQVFQEPALQQIAQAAPSFLQEPVRRPALVPQSQQIPQVFQQPIATPAPSLLDLISIGQNNRGLPPRSSFQARRF